MSTQFDYKQFPDEDHFIWNLYKINSEVSLLNLNHGEPIKEQWDKLTDEEKWHELVYALKVTADLFNELQEKEKLTPQIKNQELWTKN